MIIDSDTKVTHNFTLEMTHEELDLLLIALDSYNLMEIENPRVSDALLRAADDFMAVFYNALSAECELEGLK